jgi:hypothetical protein
MLTTIERVLALQKNPIFAEIATDGLAYLAAIAEEVEFQSRTRFSRECPDACYLILAGSVELSRAGQERTVGEGDDLAGLLLTANHCMRRGRSKAVRA